MKLTDNWFTALSESEDGRLILVSGRKDLEPFRQKGSLRIRVEISLPYEADEQGMPLEVEGELIAQIEELLRPVMERDKLAILTGNHIGAGVKHWVFYTRHLETFEDRLNDALEALPDLPIEIECQEDPQWEEYLDMLQMEQADDED